MAGRSRDEFLNPPKGVVVMQEKSLGVHSGKRDKPMKKGRVDAITGVMAPAHVLCIPD